MALGMAVEAPTPAKEVALCLQRQPCSKAGDEEMERGMGVSWKGGQERPQAGVLNPGRDEAPGVGPELEETGRGNSHWETL